MTAEGPAKVKTVESAGMAENVFHVRRLVPRIMVGNIISKINQTGLSSILFMQRLFNYNSVIGN